MEITYPKVAIGSVIRNRAWILPEYLKALKSINNYPAPMKHYVFLENDSQDDTLSQLKDFKRQSLIPVAVKSVVTNYPHWNRGDYSKNQYKHLAEMRNKLIEMVLETDAMYFLSVDSDIIVPPDILTRLLAAVNGSQNVVMAAAISNIPERKLDGNAAGNFLINDSLGIPLHPPEYPLKGIIEVDVTGAVYLIPRRLLEDGVRYGSHPLGEDFPFCKQAKEKGYSLRVMLDLVCDHRMVIK